jgi:hypothetical protein
MHVARAARFMQKPFRREQIGGAEALGLKPACLGLLDPCFVFDELRPSYCGVASNRANRSKQ